jgi:hypothetical protein
MTNVAVTAWSPLMVSAAGLSVPLTSPLQLAKAQPRSRNGR